MRALAKQERCRAPVFTDEPWGRDQCTAKVQECRFWRASARSLWRVPRRVERDRRMARRSVQECHCGISADPGAGSCEGDVDPVVCIGDDRKGRQEVPKAAPGCGGNTPTCDDRGREHDIDGVRRSGGKHHARGQERIEGEHRQGFTLIRTPRVEGSWHWHVNSHTGGRGALRWRAIDESAENPTRDRKFRAWK